MTWSTHRFDIGATLGELLQGTALAPHLAAVVELSAALLFLHEEGREIRAAFLVTAGREVTTAIVGGQGEIHAISLSPHPPTSSKTLVKQLAQLSTGCWVPCVELTPALGGGLVRYANKAYSTAITSVGSAAAGQDAIMIEKVRDGHVRVVCGPKRQWLNLVAD